MPETKVDWRNLLDEALTAPGNLTGVYDRFHDYSITNMMLFLMQGIREPVASYSRWKSLGRQVLRGARAKEVIVPVLVNEKLPEDEPVEEKRERVARLIGFKAVRAVFALSDTEGDDLPPAPIPNWNEEALLAKFGIRQIPFESTNGNLQGYSHGLEFAINPVAYNPQKTKFHEWAHIILGHTMPSVHAEYAEHRGLMEGEAEGTALIVMKELGLLDDDTAARMRGYVQHWMQDETYTDKAAQRIFKAADAILRAGRVVEATP